MAMQLLDSEEENEKLQLFIFEISDRQEAFMDAVAAKGYRLDYTFDTLSELERYIQAHAARMTWADKSDEAVAQRVDCWSYLGETFRKNYGGSWQVSLDDAQNVNYGMFVIQGFDAVGVEFEPLGTLRRYMRQAKPGGLRSMMDAHVHVAPLDLSDLPEES